MNGADTYQAIVLENGTAIVRNGFTKDHDVVTPDFKEVRFFFYVDFCN